MVNVQTFLLCMLPFHFVMYDIKLLSAMYGYIIFIDLINFYVIGPVR